MSNIENAKPAEDYEGLKRQFFALKMLAVSQQSQLSVLYKKDYSLAESKLKSLQESLDSEREMNRQLTIELENTRTQSRWISVDDRLPDKFGSYIVSDGKKIVTQMTYTSNKYAKTEKGREPRFEWMGKISPWKITYYQPLPAPPKVGE